jgi:NADPH-dependent glutamate synthase beta subunit-like oxidoreductase/NAD-dependent dihydropyrimidine dehydrogenase PreA subunit
MASKAVLPMARSVSVIGTGIRAAQCALTLAEMGVNVSLITPSRSLELDNTNSLAEPSHELLHVWPLLLRAASHPRVKLYTNSQIRNISGKAGNYTIKAIRRPRYVKEELCTGCGKCEEECSVKIQTQVNGHKVMHGAIHPPILGAKSVPSAYYIDKEGLSPCRADCPLGINVQGYIALLAKGKIDKAQALINEVAPMAGILGRLCTHPCETHCARQEIDSPVFIQSLHRFIADNSAQGIVYERKAPAGSRKEKIAIIGSGPAGLSAAWELARRGYTPTIFESHAVVGGMLATGIPRFRLPRETREKEVEAIKALGVDIKTGVTVGRDVTYSDLLDRGYKAFFLAIGAQQNNRLNIPGEDLNGVVDCISLLFSLNLKVGVSVGSNVIVIGGGNSAVDSARSAKRASKGDVRILCLTEEMTAVREEVDEALREGIPIDYNISVIEILGDGTNVKGVRCQRVRNVTFEADGKINMEYIPGSEFILKADHVVVAIGQRPNSSVLNMKNLTYGRNSTILADPLTLETAVAGVFSGGDAVTGSNNVVSATAAGLRAAESMDRYIKGHDLRKGRSLETSKPVQVKIEERKASPDKRAKMPALPFSKRKGSYEETNLGLSEDSARREAGRCLNCAICCECLECEQVCELKAVFHQDAAMPVDIQTESIVNFVSPLQNIPELKKAGIYNIPQISDDNVPAELAQAAAVALSVVADMKLPKVEKPDSQAAIEIGSKTGQAQKEKIALQDRTAVFLCRCGDSISSIIDFEGLTEALYGLPGVYSIQEISQSCIEEGSKKIKTYVEQEKIAHIVLAACRCCNLEQICFSCTDRRVMCQNNLSVALPDGVNIEYVNIREQCAWIHKDDPDGATEKALELISTGVVRAQRLVPVVHEWRKVLDNILIIGADLPGLAAAQKLAAQGRTIDLYFDIAGLQHKAGPDQYRQAADKLVRELLERGIRIFPWPRSVELNGAPGKYEAILKYDTPDNGLKINRVEAGAVILDFMTARKELSDVLANSNLISRVIARQHYFNRVSTLDSVIVHSYTVRETAGIFIVVPIGSPSIEEQLTMGQAIAARASVYLTGDTFKPRSSSVVIDAKLCRGCGDCARLCPYIELKTDDRAVVSAYVDPALCFGCGACISTCPTGAIMQPLQSEIGLMTALESMLKKQRIRVSLDE